MSDQEKKRQRIYDLLNAEIQPKFLCLSYRKRRKNFTEKYLFKEQGSERLNKKKKKKKKKGFLTALATAIKKGPTTSIKKHTYELRVHEKTVGTAIK